MVGGRALMKYSTHIKAKTNKNNFVHKYKKELKPRKESDTPTKKLG